MESIRKYARGTVLLCTHQCQYITSTDRVICIENGTIVADGTMEHVMGVNSLFTRSLMLHLAEAPIADEAPVQSETVLQQDTLFAANTLEESKEGNVAWSVYVAYFNGSAMLALFMFIMVAGNASLLGNDYWLSRYSTKSALEQAAAHDSVFDFIAVYAILLVFIFFCSWLRARLFFHLCISSSVSLFRRMLQALLLSPISFFHKNPIGRCMNRFSKDMNIIDVMVFYPNFIHSYQ